MAANRRRRQSARVRRPVAASALVREPDVTVGDEPHDDMSWLVPQSLPWLQVEEKRSA